MKNVIRRILSLTLAMVMVLSMCLLSGCAALDILSGFGKHTVVFNLNGGTLVSGELVQEVKNGESAVPPVAENGRMSLSWDRSYTDVSEDITVNAVWENTAMTSTEVAAYTQERTVTVYSTHITGSESAGSGFFIDNQGTMVTNYHVIEGSAELSVQVHDGGTYDVLQVVDFDPVHDLAVLRVDYASNNFLTLCPTPAQTGETVYAVGSALGTLTGTFTTGTVSSTSRTIGLIDCLQMDAAISHGNSGGPLVNEYGEVLGVNSFSYVDGENLNLAIKVDYINQLAMDKNMTVNEYEEWFTTESSRSWSPQDDYDNFYYSTINTYQAVTGATCKTSVDGEDRYSGYIDMCDLYIYDYNQAQYDQYVSYLKTQGFVFDSDESFSGGISYYDVNELDGILIDLFVTLDNRELKIWVTKL